MAFPDSVDDRMQHAPASAAKTALNTDIDTLGAEIDTQFSGITQNYLQEKLLDFASQIASEIKDA